MQTMGLSSSEMKKFEAQLLLPHAIRISVVILDHDEQPLGSLTVPQSYVLAGDIQIDTTNSAQTTRSLSMDILDPDKKLVIAPNSPADSAIYMDNFISVKYGVYVNELIRWVDVPVFWGPILSLERQDDNSVSIEAIGKEFLLKKPHLLWKTMRFGRGKPVVSTIKTILEARGETRFEGFPNPTDTKRKLPKVLSLSRHQEAWRVCKKLAQSMNRQLFYDGDGQIRLRSYPLTPMYRFNSQTGNNGQVTASPKLSFTSEQIRNTVEVLGHKNDQKTQVRAVAYAPRNHPLSPWSLSRNDKPRYIVETVQNDHVKRTIDAKNIAVRHLRNLLRTQVDVSFECTPIPHLEEKDALVLITDEYSIEFILTQATIPLTEQDTMSIGFNKPTAKINKKGIILRPKKRPGR